MTNHLLYATPTPTSKPWASYTSSKRIAPYLNETQTERLNESRKGKKLSKLMEGSKRKGTKERNDEPISSGRWGAVRLFALATLRTQTVLMCLVVAKLFRWALESWGFREGHLEWTDYLSTASLLATPPLWANKTACLDRHRHCRTQTQTHTTHTPRKSSWQDTGALLRTYLRRDSK